jgi:hypothetical protein
MTSSIVNKINKVVLGCDFTPRGDSPGREGAPSGPVMLEPIPGYLALGNNDNDKNMNP